MKIPKDVIVYIPESVDLEGLFKSKMDRESAAVFLSNLYVHRVQINSKKNKSFKQIDSHKMRFLIGEKKYVRIKNHLLKTGVIECDNVYMTGVKYLGYRISDTYGDGFPRKILVTGKRMREKISEMKLCKYSKIEFSENPLLNKSQKYIFQNLPRLDYYGEAPEDSRNFILADRIVRQDHYFTIDSFGRMHTALTAIKKRYRKNVKLEGNLDLVEVDISASQVIFLVMLCKRFLEEFSLEEIPSLNEEELSKVVINLESEINNLESEGLNSEKFEQIDYKKIEKQESERRNSNNKLKERKNYYHYHYNTRIDWGSFPEISNFINGPDFYQKMARYCGFEMSKSQAKRQFLVGVLFGVQKQEYFQQFQNRFPEIAAVVEVLKRENYKNLSHVLQRVESLFISRVICKLIDKEPGMFISTIHDSLVVEPHHANFVQGVIEDEFDSLGIRAQVKINA